MSRESAYALRRRTGAAGFAAAWDAALARPPVPRAAPTALERAVEGVATPVFHGKRQCGERRVFDDRALLRLLGRDPHHRFVALDTRFT